MNVAELQVEAVTYLWSQDRADGVPIHDVMQHLETHTTDAALIGRALCADSDWFDVGMDRHVRLKSRSSH